MFKRGQVTFYVIFGILLVATIIVLISFRSSIFRLDWETERQRSLDVPEQVKDVQNYILGCINSVGTQGIDILLLQGGYIYLPEEDYTINPNEPYAKSLEIMPGSDLKTSYWFYKYGNGLLKYNKPTIPEMENQLEKYVENNLGYCLQNFTLFEEFDIVYNSAKADVIIKDENVLFTVNLPVTVIHENYGFSFDNFYEPVNVRLGELYNSASKVFDYIISNNVFEDLTYDVMVVEEGVPLSGNEFTCEPQVWYYDDVKDNLKDALSDNIPYLKLAQTQNNQRENYFLRNVGSLPKDYSVIFQYIPDWPMALEIYPSEENGRILKSQSIFPTDREEFALVSSIMCMQDYSFIYNLVYPLLIVVTDENGDSMQFAMHVVLDNNQPKNITEDVLDMPDYESIICDNRMAQQMVFVLTEDVGGYQLLQDVDINIKCVNVVCDVGKTIYDRQTGNTMFNGFMPQCFNGFMSASKEGYVSRIEQVSTIDPNQIFTIFMEPVTEVGISVVAYENFIERLIVESEEFIIMGNHQDLDHTFTITSETSSINLASGVYDITAYLFKESRVGYTIKGEEFEYCYDKPFTALGSLIGLTETECQTFKAEDIQANSAIIGGGEFSWEVDRYDLSRAKSVKFRLPVKGFPESIEDFDQIIEEIDTNTIDITPRFEYE